MKGATEETVNFLLMIILGILIAVALWAILQ